MICQKCKRDGKRSKVYVGTSTVTAMYSQPYYDEDGKYVHNDPNTTTTTYWCSNSHRFSEEVSADDRTISYRDLPPWEPVSVSGGLLTDLSTSTAVAYPAHGTGGSIWQRFISTTDAFPTISTTP